MKPRSLKAGATIQFVTPASHLTEDKFVFVTGLLQDAGYRVKVAPHALDADGYLAGSDIDRANDLQAAFDDPETDAVLCTRGGYGCSRLLPLLDLERIAKSGKMFLGFSDITTLHLALNRLGMPTVHSPMALTLHYPRQPWVYESFLNVLRGDDPIPHSAPVGVPLVGGVAEGETIGGCLCLLCDSIGTPWGLQTDGRLLIIEDVDENPHRIDAMLTHLVNSGLAAKVAGFVIGEMTRTDERADKDIGAKPWREIVKDRLAPIGKPLIIDFPFGHAKNMLSLPLGVRARLDADTGRLHYVESLCQ
jgi:muramoyltetrapeptide carboxypeptidase